MPAIASFEVLAVDLPLRQPFEHSAARRSSSGSLFVRCATDTGAVGWGESLPRPYVTGESRDGTMAMLRDEILPRLVGSEFESLREVVGFLADCDGKSPGWVHPERAQSAAWCAVDLALLDTFSRAFSRAFGEPALRAPRPPRKRRPGYSGVLSARAGASRWRSCLRMRLFGLDSVKLKVGAELDLDAIARACRLLGATSLRVDANMAWTFDQALEAMRALSRLDIRCFEQPITATDLEGMARLIEETGLEVMADESLTDAASMRRLLEARACTGVNVRISKCGGLVASRRRCEEALAAGLVLQVGCQVGESSLLSAAQLALLDAVESAGGEVGSIEGCFGRRLLREDPAAPSLCFGYRGRRPARPQGSGLGVEVDPELLRRFAPTGSRSVVGVRSHEPPAAQPR